MEFVQIILIACLLCTLGQTIFCRITLSNTGLQRVAGLSSISDLDEILNHLLVDRSVISPNHRVVEEYIKSYLSNLGWTITEDEFNEDTPLFGSTRFNNIVATLNPNATRQLVLACHYDSKYFPGQEFIAATDSAVPCAMMMDLAFTMKDELDPKRSDLNVQLIFFDGEEAIKEWSDKDSLYGSRHLAARWESEGLLKKISLFVLLDLIGDANPTFFSFYENTDRWFDLLKAMEHRLDKAGMLDPSTKGGRYFRGQMFQFPDEDDHIPFLQRNVPILHLIRQPFPKVWHTLNDNKDAIDFKSVQNLMKILRVFVAEYLQH